MWNAYRLGRRVRRDKDPKKTEIWQRKRAEKERKAEVKLRAGSEECLQAGEKSP